MSQVSDLFDQPRSHVFNQKRTSHTQFYSVIECILDITLTIAVMLPMIHKRTVICPVLWYRRLSYCFKRRVGLETIFGCKARLRVATHIPAIHFVVVKVH